MHLNDFMKKTFAILSFAALLLSSCGGGAALYEISGQTYEELPSDTPLNRPVVKMNSVLSENLYFKIRYDDKAWEIDETPGEYPTNLVFQNTSYEPDTCVILPGTKGYTLEKQYEISQWLYKSDYTSGIDYEFKNPVTGIIEMRVFETSSNGEALPSVLFELHLPVDGQDQAKCYADYQEFIGTYTFDHYEGTPEELKAILQEIEEIKKQNAAAEAQKELQDAQKQAEAQSGSGATLD